MSRPRRDAVPGTTPDEPAQPSDVRAAHEAFVTTGTLPAGLRPLVAASWQRSARNGVDPETPHPEVAPEDDLAAYRSAHPLALALPVVRDLLVDALAGESMIVAVSDDAGRLLWVEGSHAVRDDVARIGFVEGAVWREDRVGTNAPGTALATGQALQVLGAEHFTRPVQSFNCAAAPVRDLRTGRTLGVLDVTGGQAVASGVVLSLVRASVAAVERELADRAVHSSARHGPALDVLGSATGTLTLPDGAPTAPGDRRGPAGAGSTRRLSLRHAEILLLLAEHPRGLAADELAVLLHHGYLSDVTVRAEISRLRRVVGPLLADSRPYRLAAPLRTDVDRVRERLAVGDAAAALAAHPGPLLPRSVAPGVERIRSELVAELRAAVLTSADVTAVERWVGTDEGADDHAAWTRLAALAPPGSPRRTRARAHLALLDRDLR